ncbi:MAG: signal peptide peptidase SppA [Opitutae bacterium]|nr:signal peptide peptidase SppA [Opitutae bacterium]
MKAFWLDVLKRFLASAGVALLFGLFSFVLLFSFMSLSLRAPEVEVPKDSILVIDLTMNVSDRPGGFDFEELAMKALSKRGEPKSFHLLELIQTIRKASADEEISGILLKGSLQPVGYGSGYAALAELGDALNEFRKSGKPIVGYAVDPSLPDYFLLSHADELFLNPYGSVLFNGMSAQVTFYGKAFEEYGIGVQVARTGEYKGAVEPFLSDRFSDSNREQLEEVLGDRWSDYVGLVARNRKLSLERLREISNDQFHLKAEDAVVAGLFDKAAHYDEVIDRLGEIGRVDEETGEFARVSLAKYVDRPSSVGDLQALEEDERPAVSVVYVEGAILDGRGDDGEFVGGDEIAGRLRDIRKDKKTKAVVLRINSPGGSVTGAEAIRREVERVRADGIPVVVSMGSVAASGGYWIAAKSERIFASPETITGSIGVFGLLPNIKDFGNRFGVTWDVVKTEPHADAFSFVRPRTETEMEHVQLYVEDIYDRFLEHVAAGRDMNKTEVHNVAKGRVWSGQDAREVGLVDEFGGLGDAILYAVELARLPDDFQLIEHPRVETPFEVLSELLDTPLASKLSNASMNQQNALVAQFKDVERNLHMFGRLNDPRSVYAVLPWFWNRGF